MPSKEKRERKRQNKAEARAAQLEAARQARRRQTMVRTGILGVGVLALAVVAAFVFGGDGNGEVAAGDDDTATTVTTAAGDGIVCDEREPEEVPEKEPYDAAPEMAIDPAKVYTATLDTSCGEIVVELDAAGAPKAVNNFVFLANEDFYDGVKWHRVVDDFVIQGGDPQGDGTGGPGYEIEAEPPSDGYRIGSLAAAKAGTAPDGTFGSQFFIVTGSRGAALPNQYARFGVVTEGIEVAEKLESFSQDDQTPSRELWIFDVTITESDPGEGEPAPQSPEGTDPDATDGGEGGE